MYNKKRKNIKGASRSRRNQIVASNQNNNSIYIGGALIAGALLLYSGLKYFFPKRNEEKATVTTNTNEKASTNKTTTPKNINTKQTTAPKRENEVLESDRNQSFSKKNEKSTTPTQTQQSKKEEDEKLKEFSKLLEQQKIETKNLTKRILNAIGEKDLEAFKCNHQKKKKNFPILIYIKIPNPLISLK
jgi:multidrug efflux pump subunit AcrB